MIDSPPTHADTVLTTLVHLEKCLITFGMQYIHLAVGMQLYLSVCFVQRNDPEQWHNFILLWGMVLTVMSFGVALGH